MKVIPKNGVGELGQFLCRTRTAAYDRSQLVGGLVDLSEEVKPLWSDIPNGCGVSFSLVLL